MADVTEGTDVPDAPLEPRSMTNQEAIFFIAALTEVFTYRSDFTYKNWRDFIGKNINFICINLMEPPNELLYSAKADDILVTKSDWINNIQVMLVEHISWPTEEVTVQIVLKDCLDHNKWDLLYYWCTNVFFSKNKAEKFLAYAKAAKSRKASTLTIYQNFIENTKLSPSITSIKIADSIRKAFTEDYIDDKYALERFANFLIVKILGEYNKPEEAIGTYYALYFAFVQSSGYGKSRLLLEAARRVFNLVYVCLRPADSSGYPGCNIMVMNHLRGHNSDNDLQHFIACTYLVAASIVLEAPADQEGFPLASHIGEDDAKFEDFWTLVIERCASTESRDSIKEYKNLQTKFNFNRHSQRKNGVITYEDGVKGLSELLIVFDEASFLLDNLDEADKNIFRNLRVAQKKLESTNCVLVFVDTLSSIGNFVPARSMDPSGRMLPGFRLLPPYFEITTYDALAKLATKWETGPDYDLLLERFARGRPLWASVMKRLNPENAAFEVVVFAYYKLGYGHFDADKARKQQMQLYENCAILAIRFGINGIMDHTLGSNLMASFMGTAIYFGPDRIRLMVRYVCEPALFEAACRRLHDNLNSIHAFDFQRIASLIIENYEYWTKGTVNVGDLGELTCRILLGLSYDWVKVKSFKDMTKDFFSHPITVREFLDVLVPSDIRKTMRILVEKGLRAANKQIRQAYDDELKKSEAERTMLEEEKTNLEDEKRNLEDERMAFEEEKLSLRNAGSDKKGGDVKVPKKGSAPIEDYNIVLEDSLTKKRKRTSKDTNLPSTEDENQKAPAFLPEEIGDPLSNLDPKLLGGHIIMTGFIYLESLPPGGMTQDLLRRAYQCSVGVILPKGFKGADLFIPVHLGNGIFTFILIQVKDVEDITTEELCKFAGEKLTPEHCFSSKKDSRIKNSFVYNHPEPYLSILFDLREESMSSLYSKNHSVKSWRLLSEFFTTYPNHYILPGIFHYPFMVDPLKTAIQGLMSKEIDFIDKDDRAEVLRDMDSFSFRLVGGRCQCTLDSCGTDAVQGERTPDGKKKVEVCACRTRRLQCTQACNCRCQHPEFDLYQPIL